MAVYEGVLEQMSGGGRVSEDAVVVDEDGWVVGRRRGDNRIRRAFLEIGGKHVKDVVLSPYHDQLLVDSIGEDVALSTFGRRTKQVVAVRTRRGVDRPGFFRVLWGMVAAIVVYWVFAFIVASFFLGAGALFPAQEDLLFWVGNAVVIVLLVWPFVRYVRIFRARGALKQQAPVHPPLTS